MNNINKNDKIIKITFACKPLTINNYIEDFRKAVEYAKINLLRKYNIKISILEVNQDSVYLNFIVPDNLIKNESDENDYSNSLNVGKRLKGISNYLLKYSDHKYIYNSMLKGKRLLDYQDITDLYTNGNYNYDNIYCGKTNIYYLENLKILKNIIYLIENSNESNSKKLIKIKEILNK